jgi:SAM-dependent methyltransferase
MISGHDRLHRLFALASRYSQLFDAYHVRGVDRELDDADKEFTQGETWRIDHYFSAGADAVRVIVDALIGAGCDPPSSILDFPSGSGRVTRHLKSFFPDARIVACDLYDYHVRFCANRLGVSGTISKEDLDQLDLKETFDLIFCGSLLTHLPPDGFRAAMRFLSRSLSERGVAVVTLHGRHSLHIQHHKWEYLPPDRFAILEQMLPAEGVGYVDYHQPMKAVFDRQRRYGIMVSMPRWTMAQLEHNYGVRVFGYAERAWDDHQDVLTFGKPPVNAD